MDNYIRNITKSRFNALIFLREIMAEQFFEEVEWFEAFGGKMLALMVRDRIDGEYLFNIFARDERKVFRFHRLSSGVFETRDEAYAALVAVLEPYMSDGKSFYEESPIKKKTTDLFRPLVKPEKFHPFFALLMNGEQYNAAKNIIQELAYHFWDVDGNFVKDFQTTHFNARLWELFLHVYFAKHYFKILPGFQVPDFCLNFYGQKVFIEAVTVNSNPEFDAPYPKSPLEEHLLTKDFMAIKYAKTLTNKLNRMPGPNYWDLDHVKGHSFLLAVHDYHDQGNGNNVGSMTWSRSALPDYLYGYRIKATIMPNETIDYHTQPSMQGPIPLYEKIAGHNYNGKGMPSGFFFLPNAENISAVLFANNATLSTFNRIGKLGKFGGEKDVMWRIMSAFDPKSGSYNAFRINVDDPMYDEDWGDSVAIYHNPVAKFPLNPDIFPDATHFIFDLTRIQMTALIADKYVLSSYTLYA